MTVITITSLLMLTAITIKKQTLVNPTVIYMWLITNILMLFIQLGATKTAEKPFYEAK